MTSSPGNCSEGNDYGMPGSFGPEHILDFEACSVHHGITVWARLRAPQPEAVQELLPGSAAAVIV